MNRIVVLATLAAIALTAAPAFARDYVQDGAGMFSKQAIGQADGRIAAFNQATGKEVVVVTVPSLGGATLQDAAAKAFSQQNVDGVLIFIARDDRRDIIVPDRAGAAWFTPDVLQSIRQQMEGDFKNEAFDSGLLAGVGGVLDVYRQHLQGRAAPNGGLAPSQFNAPASRLPATQGVHISMFWWIVIVVVGFLILRSVMRAFSTPRYGPPGAPGAPGAAPPAGYGPGYGPGYGGYGGGGSFWSGLLGGLGGAWLGNEMFGNRGGGAIAPADASQGAAPDAGGGWGGDSGGGWQSDAGQADMSGASGGDWSGGGFGDSGGGGDFGGGGGDSGGGW